MRPPPLPSALAVLTAANLLNNRLAPRAYVPTSVAAAAVLVAIARADGCTWADLGMGRAGAGRGLRVGAALTATVAAGYAAAAALPATRPLLTDRRVAGLALPEVLHRALVRVPCGTVLLEEVAFRGVLYALLRRRYGTARATAVSAALFGLWHLLPAGELPEANPELVALGRGAGCAVGAAGTGSPAGVPAAARARAVAAVMAGTAAGGVVLCELRRRTGGLAAPVSLHAALNGLGYLAGWAVTRRAPGTRAAATRPT